ncbi:MAG: two-component system, OmpR family, alkaline phosphatase synthesis response regulator PhoP [Blastocatellia bacterium]|jgi:CheY-like chemotaxis protein|nr:two-component system, OmpR family, alkaline phosphatase synthesis response regulator PhoP [Blastocatellia bacterium]
MPPPHLRVLYCEDDADTREMMRLILEAEGFEVICPEDPHECLRLAKHQQFDAYLLDNFMSDLPGIDLCKQIREFDLQTPVIFFSGAAYQTDKEKAIAAGAQAYITKPATVEDLIGAIRRAILPVKDEF